jgi:hypothetical protein
VIDGLAADLLRRRVSDSPDHSARRRCPVERRSGHAEVRQVRALDSFVVAEQNVLRLDVTMDQPVRMRGIEPGCHLGDEGDRTLRIQATFLAEQACEIRCLELHRDERLSLMFTGLVYGQDVPVSDGRG